MTICSHLHISVEDKCLSFQCLLITSVFILESFCYIILLMNYCNTNKYTQLCTMIKMTKLLVLKLLLSRIRALIPSRFTCISFCVKCLKLCDFTNIFIDHKLPHITQCTVDRVMISVYHQCYSCRSWNMRMPH